MSKPNTISLAEEELFRRIFRYDSETGLLWRKVGPWVLEEHPVGTPVGRGGYLQVQVAQKKYYVHRIIWFLVYNEWPDNIDHKDTKTNNNRLNNLRKATHSQNQANRPVRWFTETGVKGVIRSGERFSASITIARVQCHIGIFETLEEAKLAYEFEAAKLYGEFAHAV